MSDEEIIQQPIRALLEIYLRELAEVRFGDVDGKALQVAAEHVERRVLLVRSAEQALTAARADLASAERSLLTTAQQAMGYARIYAQDRPELLANLEGIALPNPQRELLMTPSGPSRPRGRPARSRSNVAGKQVSDAGPMASEPLLAPTVSGTPGDGSQDSMSGIA